MDYYEIDSRKYTFAEYWRFHRKVAATWTMKILGRRIDYPYAIPYPTRIDRLDPADVPGGHRQAMQATIDDCERLGLRLKFFYTEPGLFISVEGMGAVLLSDDGHTMALLAYVEIKPSGRARRALGFVTRLQAAGFVETTTAKQHFDDRPGSDVARFPQASAEELLDRHRQRVRRRGGAVEPFVENELENVVATETNALNRHRIERGLLVPCPPEKLERLRAGAVAAPRPAALGISTLRSLAFWLAFWIVIVFLWKIFITNRKPAIPDSRSVGELMSTTTRLPLACADLPEVSIRPDSPFRPHGFTVTGVFADADAASRSEAGLGPAEDGELVRLGPVLFFRHAGVEGVEPASWRPIADRLSDLGARTLIEAPGYERSLTAGLLWRLDDPETADELETALNAYLGTPYFLMLRAPWAPPDVGTPLTAAERRARRYYQVLSRGADFAGHGYVWRYLQVVRKRDPKALHDLMEDQKRRYVERQRRVAEKLKEEYPDLDPELVRRYLDHLDSPMPELGADPSDPAYQRRVAESIGEQYRRGAALGELMGQLDYRWPAETGRPPEVVDPAHAYTAWAAEVLREGAAFRLDSLLFDDVALGLPALLAELCDAGAGGLVLTLDEYEDV